MWHSLISLLFRQEFKSNGAGDESGREWPAETETVSPSDAASPLESIQVPHSVSFAECAGLMFTDGLDVETELVS